MKMSFNQDRFEGTAASHELGLFRAGLLRNAMRLVGPADAEDVVQDAFERAWRTNSLRPDTDPRPWLKRITRNVAFDVLNGRKRMLPLYAEPEPVESAEHTVVRRETAADVDVALQTLPAAQRRTIVLHDFDGYSSHEIAHLDGVAYHTVRTRLFRARQAMRAALETVAA
jgi:RNA polymerase sigma-70 factor (ECF subfamily)